MGLSNVFAPMFESLILVLRIRVKRPIWQKLLPTKETVMNIDDLILALLIHRDNQGPHIPVTVVVGDRELPMNQIVFGAADASDGGVINTLSLRFDTRGGKPNVNHMMSMPAREADDLRKMSYHFLAFRQAVCEFASTKYTAYDPDDPQRFKRLRSQMVETARDLTGTMGHIDGECVR